MNILPGDNMITEITDANKQLLYDAMYEYYIHCSRTAKSNSVAKDLAKKAEATLICMRNAWGQDIIH